MSQVSSQYLVFNHVAVNGTLSGSELVLVFHRCSKNVTNISNKNREEEDSNHPAADHEDDLRRVLRLVVLTDGCCGFGSKVETSEVRISLSIIDKTVASYSLVVGNSKVGAGIQMNEVDHVDDGLHQPQNVLIVSDPSIQPDKEL